jgi:hypothetical protein
VVITTNPASIKVIQNQTATFTVAGQETPAGSGIGYQWQRKPGMDKHSIRPHIRH